MNKRSQARQAAMKALYQMDLVGTDLDQALADLAEIESLPRDVVRRARVLAGGTFAHREEIDAQIARHLRSWDFSRVGHVEKSILRLAVFELMHGHQTPVKVALNEALELCKEYATLKAVRFVNGILHQIAREAPPRPARARAPALSDRQDR
jgi:N utilization substance protein B